MATLFARHMIANFEAWKKEYDEFDATRQAMGVTSHGVFRGDENPNDITLYHEFETMEAAKAFGSSEELKAAMEKAGVTSAPNIWFANMMH